MNGSVELRLPNAAHGAKAFLELVDPSLGVHELRKSGEEGMGIGSDADRDDAMFHTVDDFLFLGSLGRAADETLAGGHVNKDDRIVFRMKVLFHENLVPATFPTQRDAEIGEKHQPVKLASINFNQILKKP